MKMSLFIVNFTTLEVIEKDYDFRPQDFGRRYTYTREHTALNKMVSDGWLKFGDFYGLIWYNRDTRPEEIPLKEISEGIKKHSKVRRLLV